MQPTCALSLSYDGITLYARQADDSWLSLGEVKLPDPDLSGALSDLLGEAVAHSGTRFTTLLILPSDQLLFTEATVTSEAAAAAEIAKHLEGRTPYDVADLVYDWSGSGTTRKVAAVAIETLAEAEAFATEFGFNPVAFGAVVPEGAFFGQPFLGECAGAEARLAGRQVAREKGPFRVTKRTAPAPEPPAVEAKTATSPKGDTPVPPPAEAASATEPTFSRHRPLERAGRDGTGAADRLARIKPRLNRVLPVLSASESVAEPSPALTIPPAPPPLAAAHSAPAPTPPAPASAALSRDGALGGLMAETVPRGNRFGMWLTLALLMVLLLIGALSLIAVPPGSVSGWFKGPPAEQDTATAEPPVASPETLFAYDLLPSSENALALEGGDFSALALAPQPNELALEPEPEALSDTDDLLAGNDDLPTEDEVIREEQAALPLPNALDIVETYAATGIWIGTPEAPEPPAEDTIETLYQTTLDAPIAHADAVAMPSAALQMALVPPRSYLPPPPPGTTFAVDERGLVTPTPDGIVTPEGVAVIAGAPPVDVLPDPRPTPPGSAPAPETADGSDAAPGDAEQAARRALLALIKPTPRPANSADTVERAENNGLTLAELRRPQPQPRPQSLQARAEEEARLATAVAAAAAQAAQQASLASPGSAAGGGEGSNPGGIALGRAAAPPLRVTPQSDSALAIARSAPPRARPADAEQRVARIVERAQTRAAASNTARAASTASVAAVAPRAASQSAPATTRTLPPGGSVARAATDENALRLRQINLIGVFGKPSDPKALVRLPSGRTVRVGIGDRVDNGRVTSIGAGRLTYRRGSRDLVLEMPRI